MNIANTRWSFGIPCGSVFGISDAVTPFVGVRRRYPLHVHTYRLIEHREALPLLSRPTYQAHFSGLWVSRLFALLFCHHAAAAETAYACYTSKTMERRANRSDPEARTAVLALWWIAVSTIPLNPESSKQMLSPDVPKRFRKRAKDDPLARSGLAQAEFRPALRSRQGSRAPGRAWA